MNIKPIFDRVIAKEILEKNETHSGIILSEEELEQNIKRAVVIEVGKGVYEDGFFIGMEVSVGNIIYYEKHTSIPFNYNGENYILIKQTDILAKEEKRQNEKI